MLLDQWKKRIIFFISICMSFFALYAALTQDFEAYFQRTIFLGFCLVLVFLTRPATRRRSLFSFWALDLPLVILSLVPVVYGGYEHHDLFLRVGESTTADFAVGLLFILLIFEATRRAVGWPILILTIILMLYTLYGTLLPPAIGHAGYSLRELVELNYMSLDGIYGVTLGVVVDFIFIFVIFGALLEACGGVQRFTEVAKALMGWQTGGPAKAAVLASGIMGSLSGSSAANVVTTGSFTIPMMKRLGYSSTFAGAVEAAASTGGQIMPPIMGASAFVIMAILGVSYLDVCKATVMPAIFYFVSVGICVHYFSKKIGLRGLPREELPPVWPSLVQAAPMLVPVVVIIGILAWGYTAIMAGFWAVISLLVFSTLQKGTRLTPQKFLSSLSVGSLNILGIAIVCASAGIIVSCFLVTGLGMRISAFISEIAGAKLFLPGLAMYVALGFAALACIVLGMGMPTVGAYIIVATLGAPALIDLGFSPMATHVFVFFYGILSNVTPPVALAAYAATPIAGEGTNAWKIGWRAFTFTLSSFIIPFIFIENTALLLDGSLWKIIYTLIIVGVAILSFNLAIVGYCSRKLLAWERVLFIVGALLLFEKNYLTDGIGMGIVCALLLWQSRKRGAVQKSPAGA
ncbi:MAG: TRAP transporter fused permease subunit [Desulfarculus sp.]|jgi:TRAP transporter 4TM/12TM fusion protein|nr:MAG: TRAP transporter fused permease subunit [Desulfarculus sp.]